MPQQINLLDPLFRAQKVWLSSRQIAWAAAGLVALFGVAVAWEGWQLRTLAHELARLAQERQDTALRLGEIEAGLVTRSPDPALAAEVQRLELLNDHLEQIRATLASDGFTSGAGYSDYFTAFARQIIDGLWVTGFTIDGAGRSLSLRGRTLRAELVPRYLQRLSVEPPLAGTEFRSLHLAQPDKEDRAQPMRYIDFVVDTDLILAIRYNEDPAQGDKGEFDVLRPSEAGGR